MRGSSEGATVDWISWREWEEWSYFDEKMGNLSVKKVVKLDGLVILKTIDF